MLKQQRRITALTLAQVESKQLAAGTQQVETVAVAIVDSPEQALEIGTVHVGAMQPNQQLRDHWMV